MSNTNTSNTSLSNIYLWAIVLIWLAVSAVSVKDLLNVTLDLSFFILVLITIFFSSYLRIQLPRTKIHLSVSEVLVFYTLLIYGSGAAVLLASLESLYTSFNFRRQGINIKNRTILFNVTLGGISTYFTAFAVNSVYTSPKIVITEETIAGFGGMLICMAIAQFLCNSIGVSIYTALKSKDSLKTFWEFWFDYCFNALVMYIAAALIAGIGVKALSQVNMFLFMLAFAVSAIFYLTYRRYVDDVKTTSAKAEQSERQRAEQAERHIEELQHSTLR